MVFDNHHINDDNVFQLATKILLFYPMNYLQLATAAAKDPTLRAMKQVPNILAASTSSIGTETHFFRHLRTN